VEKITGQIEISQKQTEEIQKKIKHLSNLKEALESSFDKEITEVLKIMLGGSLTLRASDIHLEPEKEQAKIRIRIDGLLQDVLFTPLKTYDALLSRIKLLSEIKLNITDRPQDGRFSLISAGLPIEIRASALPAEYGESIVMRILNPKSLIDLSGLGLREDLLKLFQREILKPNGMIIVTGPTGSGKTTTLYAFLKRVQKPEIKIITIEDPIEYHLEGVSQTQVAPEKGYDFAGGLKSIMRQDPDVILVGEIRDLETANIALQASLTGHLVLSTLHTNDAAGTIARLIDLGASSSSIAPAINMAVAQRLVRIVCKKCAKLSTIDSVTLQKIKKALSHLPKGVRIPALTEKLKIPKIKGCQFCNFTGYQGRVGIFEAFLVDDEMENFILTMPSIPATRDLSIKKGMTTMFQDGLIKVLEGITTTEEVERVTGE